MNIKNYIILVLWIVAYVGLAFLIGQGTQGSIDGWYATLNKPSFNPPNWVFAPVWTVLYIMIATAGWRLWDQGASVKLKTLFMIYTALNFAWTPVFFGLHLILPAFVLIVAINIVSLWIIRKAWGAVPLSAYLFIAPTLWTLFAAALNLGIFLLN